MRCAAHRLLALTTYFPASWRHRDYRGDTWYGTSHESDVPGVILHSFRWVNAQCSGRGLVARNLGIDRVNGQFWIEITRRGAASRR